MGSEEAERISTEKSASLQRLIAHCWRVSRYLSGETSHKGTSGDSAVFTCPVTKLIRS
jgi:hypothetical protein